jgi:hypothetical protein
VTLSRLALLACAGALSIAASQASAATYIITGVGSGSLNGTAFSNKSFTFTLVGSPSSGTSVDPLTSAKVTIAGFAETTFQIATRLRESGTFLYLSRGSNGSDLFGMQFLSPLNLTAANPGSQALSAFTSSFTGVDTSLGALTFTSIDQVTFTSTLAAPVPEPATWAMMIAGFGLVGAAMRRRPARVAVAYA